MQVSVQVTHGLERRMSVSIPAADVQNEVDRRIHDYAQRVRIDGFRPGKVPVKLVRKRYGLQLRQETLGDLVEEHYRGALQQEGLVPAGQPKIEPKLAGENGEDGDFVFDAVFEVYPDIEIADFAEIEIERIVCDVTDADVDKMLDTLRRQRTRWDTVERAAVQGDQVTADYTGYLDGETVEQAAQQDAEVVLGAGRMLPDFEHGLTGVKAGESVSFDVTFPEDYPGQPVAGKTLNFQAQIKAVAEPVLPDLDEAFVQSFGIESGDMAQLRAKVRDNMVTEVRERLRRDNKDAVMQAIADNHELTLPQALVAEETRHLQDAQQHNRQAPPAQASAEALEQQARRRVQLGLVVRRIVDMNDIQVDQALLEERLNAIAVASGIGDPQVVKRLYRDDPRLIQEVEVGTLEEQVVEWVYGRANVKTVSRSFEDIVG